MSLLTRFRELRVACGYSRCCGYLLTKGLCIVILGSWRRIALSFALSLGMSIAQRLALMSSLVRSSSRGFLLDMAMGLSRGYCDTCVLGLDIGYTQRTRYHG